MADKLPMHYMFLCIAFFAIITINRKRRYTNTADDLEKITDTLLHETDIYTTIEHDMKQYNKTMYMTLILQIMYGLINYITLLFVPIMAKVNHMSLSQIAILFAVSYIPQMASYGLSNIRKNYNKFIVSCTALILVGICL